MRPLSQFMGTEKIKQINSTHFHNECQFQNHDRHKIIIGV